MTRGPGLPRQSPSVSWAFWALTSCLLQSRYPAQKSRVRCIEKVTFRLDPVKESDGCDSISYFDSFFTLRMKKVTWDLHRPEQSRSVWIPSSWRSGRGRTSSRQSSSSNCCVFQTAERLNRNDQVRQFNAYLFCLKCFSVYIFAKARNELSIPFDAWQYR